MIFRKPYAFLIKNFTFLHVVLAAIIGYLSYKTKQVLDLYNEYIVEQVFDIEATGLFNRPMFILPVIFLVVLALVLIVLVRKRKPYVFYIVNIVIAVGTLIVYNYAFESYLELENMFFELRVLNFIRDLVQITFYAQLGSSFILAVRALGIDVKKFGIKEELKKLNISEEDNEEVEVNIDVDTEELQRSINKTKRFIKYYYLEHKLLSYVIILSFILLVTGTTLLLTKNDNRSFDMNVKFYTDDYSINVKNAYITKNNYKIENITSKYYVIVNLDVANLNGKSRLKLNEFQLYKDEKVYYPKTNISTNSFIDLGTYYNNEKIEDEKSILLVYELESSGDIAFRYIRNYDNKWGRLDPIYDEVDLNVIELDTEIKQNAKKIGEEITIENTNLKDSKIKLTGFKMDKTVKLNYNFCLAKENCYASVEYLNPKLDTRYDKAILTLEGTYLNGNSLNDYNLYTFLEKFGKIIYSNDGKTYMQNIKSRVTPSKVIVKDKYFIEVDEKVLSADYVILQIQVRNNIYQYVLN